MLKRETIKAYIYIFPALLCAFLFSLYPFLKALGASFLTINQGGKILGYAGLENYRRLFTDRAFYHSIRITIIFTLLFVPLNTLLTLLTASLTKRKSRLSSLSEFIFFTPMAFSLSAAALVFRTMFTAQNSIANRILHTSINYLASGGSAMAVLVLLGVFLDLGLDYMILLSAFRSIDKSIIEAAEIDGASRTRTYFSIELPLIREMLLTTIFLAIKDALLIVAPIIILTEGGPFGATSTVMFYYYTEAFRSGNRAIGNTLTVISVLLSIVISTLFFKRRRDNG